MEKQLKCFQLLRLKEMALRKVAVLLWNGSDISASLSKVGRACVSNKERQKDIEDKLLKLGFPESLSKEMIDIVRPISLEESEWEKSLYILFGASSRKETHLPDSAKLCWTTSGTINHRKTAEELLRCDELDVKQRYKLACHYCLEDHISLYWGELPEEEKQNYSNRADPLSHLSCCWPCILQGERSKLDCLARKSGRYLSFNQFAFEYSAERGDKTAAEYFFQKLIPEEREASLMRTARAVIADRYNGCFDIEKRSDLLRYLLSVMTPEQQMEIIKSYPIYVFSCFLHWSLRDLFLENAGLLWSFLPPSRYTALVGKIMDGYLRPFFPFPKLFSDFFRTSPQDFKKWFVDEESEFGSVPASRFLMVLFGYDDSECIEVMFGSLDAADRVKLVFNRHVLQIFHGFVFRGTRWRLLEVCLREAELSEEEKGRLKVAFTGSLKREELKHEDCKRILEFIDHADRSSDLHTKRLKLENGSSSEQ